MELVLNECNYPLIYIHNTRTILSK